MRLGYDTVSATILGRSQKGQDSYIKHTFDNIGTVNKYYVEFGACDGVEMSNTYYLRRECGWSGLLLDMHYDIPALNLHKRFLTKDNICSIFAEFNVPNQFDFLCVDIDGMDYWILDSLLEEYVPRMIMVETNVRFDPYVNARIKYDPDWVWDGRKWYGASPYAYKQMLNKHGYTPVWIHIDDMIVLHNDVIEQYDIEVPAWETVYPGPNVEIYSDQHKGEGLITELDLNEWEVL